MNIVALLESSCRNEACLMGFPSLMHDIRFERPLRLSIQVRKSPEPLDPNFAKDPDCIFGMCTSA
ncbi:hypothetical protein [Thioalkalivibrio sp. HK1]|uniref:hypothetical protein n=1 Tax=Thioalkalivibrio sp. HK1 TaxID=1469245 RepID=UPI0012DF6E77|nr:hypothetical protein [Thioalkalivibrio sp. HK1]